jgi:hypothetical protein
MTAPRRRSKHSRSNEEKGGVSLETGVSNFGKTEACPARLLASVATPEEKLGISTNKPLTDALTFLKSVLPTPSSIDPNMQQPSPEMG